MIALFAIPKAMTRCLLVLLVVLPFASLADVYYTESGQITRITRTHIYAGDLHYKLSPTVKVMLKSGKPGSTKDLAKGDEINMRILNLDGKSSVDSILQIANEDEIAEESNQ